MRITIVTVLLAFLFVAATASDESLVISTLISHKGDWSVVELLACTSISDLSLYSFKQYNGDKISPKYAYSWDFVSVPAGARIYASSLSDTRFKKFFGFAPQYFSYSSEHIRFNGSNNVQLVYDESTIVDAYGVVGQNISVAADFTNGWAARKPSRDVASTFIVSDWNVHIGALSSNPSNNSYANPPVQVKRYLCPGTITSAPSQQVPSQAPSQWPTPSPTLKESLVISTIVNHPSWNAVEVTACTDIADLSLYSLRLFGWSVCCPMTTPSYIYNWNLLAIPAGSRVYVSTAPKTDFQNFFGFTPEHFFLASDVLLFGGSWKIQLVFDGSWVVDAYGVVGDEGGVYQFDDGWVGHRTGKKATYNFAYADWNLHYKALNSNPSNNSDASPPIEFERYQCPELIKIPTKHPTKHPTNGPNKQPTKRPIKRPTKPPTKHPSKQPSPTRPTRVPSQLPTQRPGNTTEQLIMTALVDHLGDWRVLELFACSKIADLSLYSFKQYQGYNGASPHTYNWNGSKPLPTGSRIYVSSMSVSDFKIFFDFQPKYFFPSFSNVLFTGASKVQLVYRGSMVVDSYDSSHGSSGNFMRGWVGRKAGKQATANFNVSDWDVHNRSFNLNPLKNSDAFPPVQLGKYKCANMETKTSAPTHLRLEPPSRQPTKLPTHSHATGRPRQPLSQSQNVSGHLHSTTNASDIQQVNDMADGAEVRHRNRPHTQGT